MTASNNKIVSGLGDAVAFARNREVIIDYTNWRGQRAPRRIVPKYMVWSSNQWHKEPQWLRYAWDVKKKDYRYFALKDIHMWEPKT